MELVVLDGEDVLARVEERTRRRSPAGSKAWSLNAIVVMKRDGWDGMSMGSLGR